MPEHDPYNTPELVELRNDIVADLVSLTYWVQTEHADTGHHVGAAESIVRKLSALHENTPVEH